MLVSFTFENWRSFRDTNTLNLVASTEKQHGERVPTIKDYDLRLLPTSAIYGGNASGKSNLFKALSFARWMVAEGPTIKGSIPLDTFRLDASQHQPARFGFVILVQDKEGQEQVYDYGFTLSKAKVLEEKLVWIKKSSEVVLFQRQNGKPSEYHKTITQDQILHAVLESTRDNQLFLTNAAGQNISKYKTEQVLRVFNWFGMLTLVSPNDVSVDMMLEQPKKHVESILALLGTGIVKLRLENVDLGSLDMPTDWIDDMKTRLSGEQTSGAYTRFGDRYLFSQENGELLAHKLVSVHQSKPDDADIIFDLKDDSDGTVRVIDLLPCFLEAAKQGSDRVFMIDELDRSLHTLLVRQLLESYLASCSPESRSQIIFTTHDVLQMDQNLLRRDEMWVIDRKNDGATELVPLSSFKEIRKDKSIRTSYLRGHLGGTPKLLLFGAFPQEVVKETR